MKIVVVGGGNLGLSLTGFLAYNTKHTIWLYTEKNILKYGSLKIIDIEDELSYETENFIVSFDKQKTFCDVDVVLCTYPAFLRPKFSKEIEEVLNPKCKLIFLPGYGGVEYCCKNLIDKGLTIFGLQRVPFITRAELNDTGYVAKILSKKKNLKLASFPNCINLCDFFENNFKINTTCFKSFLPITLCNSNPILHLCGVYNAFKDYSLGVTYKNQLYMYDIWNDETSELLIKYDTELQSIYKKISLKYIDEYTPLTEYYEANTANLMTKKLKSIEAFKEVKVPLKEINGAYVPDLNSRVFIEDFPYGICIYRELANLFNIEVPVMDMLLSFYDKISGIKYYDKNGIPTSNIENTGSPIIFGLNTKKKIQNYYEKGDER